LDVKLIASQRNDYFIDVRGARSSSKGPIGIQKLGEGSRKTTKPKYLKKRQNTKVKGYTS
jgi:hypothetical protein